MWKFFFALKRSNLFYFSKVEKALLLNYFFNMTGSIFHGWHAVAWRRMKCFWEHFRHLARSLARSSVPKMTDEVYKLRNEHLGLPHRNFELTKVFYVIELSTGLTFVFFWIWLANLVWELNGWLLFWLGMHTCTCFIVNLSKFEFYSTESSI